MHAEARGPDREARARWRLLRRSTTLSFGLVALLTGAVGACLLYIGGRSDWWRGRVAGQVFVAEIGSLLVAAVGIALLWELIGKRSFGEEILARAGLSTEITSAGIVKITNQYLREVEWDEYFRTVNKLDIVFAYGRTWRATHYDQLTRVAQREGARMRVILPDPTDELAMTLLAQRFDMTPAKLKEAIEEATADFNRLRADARAEIAIFYRRGDQVFSCYRLDDLAIVTLYSNSRERKPVPTLVCREGGTLYDFLRQEIDAMLKTAQELPPSAEKEGMDNEHPDS